MNIQLIYRERKTE